MGLIPSKGIFKFSKCFSSTPYFFGLGPTAIDLDMKLRKRGPTDDLFREAQRTDILFITEPLPRTQLPVLKKFHALLPHPRRVVLLKGPQDVRPFYNVAENLEQFLPIDLVIPETSSLEEQWDQAFKALIP